MQHLNYIKSLRNCYY